MRNVERYMVPHSLIEAFINIDDMQLDILRKAQYTVSQCTQLQANAVEVIACIVLITKHTIIT